MLRRCFDAIVLTLLLGSANVALPQTGQPVEAEQPKKRTTEQIYAKLKSDLDRANRSFSTDPTSRDLLEATALASFNKEIVAAIPDPGTLDAAFDKLSERLATTRVFDAQTRAGTRTILAQAARQIYAMCSVAATDLTEPKPALECYEDLLKKLRAIKSRFRDDTELRGILEGVATEIFNLRLNNSTVGDHIDYVQEFTTKMKLVESEFGPATQEETQKNPAVAEAKAKDQAAYQATRSALQAMLNRVVQLQK